MVFFTTTIVILKTVVTTLGGRYSSMGIFKNSIPQFKRIEVDGHKKVYITEEEQEKCHKAFELISFFILKINSINLPFELSQALFGCFALFIPEK